MPPKWEVSVLFFQAVVQMEVKLTSLISLDPKMFQNNPHHTIIIIVQSSIFFFIPSSHQFGQTKGKCSRTSHTWPWINFKHFKCDSTCQSIAAQLIAAHGKLAALNLQWDICQATVTYRVIWRLTNWGLTGWLIHRLTDWQIDCQIDWGKTGRLIRRLTCRLIGRLANRLTEERLVDWLKDTVADWLVDWLTDWLTDWPIDWGMTGRLISRLTDWQTDWLMY